MKDIVGQFVELARAHPVEFRDAIHFLEEEMERRNCRFGKKIVPVFLRPIFLEQTHAQEISGVLDHIINILEKVSRLYFTHPDLKEYYYLNPKGKELIEIDHGYQKNIIVSRPDSFLIRNSLRFVEFNCDSPAGPGLSDIEEEIFKSTFPLQKLAEFYRYRAHGRCECLLEALLSVYKEFAGSHKKPNIAIVDWREVRTQNEFQIIQGIFRNKGYDTIIADPRDLKFREGRLECDGFPIDLIYRRVIFRELISRLDDVGDFIQAFKKGKVCVANPFRSRLASSKAILSIITNKKEFKDFFTAEENHIISKHIPWTRRVQDIQTHYEDNKVFLRKHISHHRENLVLKPSDSYGGKDVVVGRDCDQVDWEILLNRILTNKEDWVVQRYVEITETEVPVIHNGRIEFRRKKFNMNPFVFAGQYAGSMARMSDQSVINVSAGGGLVPVIEYEGIS